MAGRVTVRAVNDELARLGHEARLEKASGYFYLWTGEASHWTDATVRWTRSARSRWSSGSRNFHNASPWASEARGVSYSPQSQ
jgi:hypothetical protein